MDLLRATPVPGWERTFPWLWARTTWRTGAPPGQSPASAVVAMESGIGAGALEPGGWKTVVRSRQVHGALCHVHGELPAGEEMAADGDGHATGEPGILLAITLADCVPVFVADPVNRAVGLLHAGWRGTAAGVVEEGLEAMRRAFGSVAAELHLHLGPSICGRCYEVGPEVFVALGEPPPPRSRPLDLRRVIGRRALAAGVAPTHLTTSAECTLCSRERYYSHRGGDRGRHLALIGVLPAR